MEVQHTGHCQCGNVSYEVMGEPVTSHACHCRECQKRTGSAFGVSMVLKKEEFRIQGDLHTFDRLADSGFKITQFFCPNCGNTIYGEVEQRPNAFVLFPGTLDDTSWFGLDRMIWTSSAQGWYEFPKGVEKLEMNASYGS
jgi:hypothetical protein